MIFIASLIVLGLVALAIYHFTGKALPPEVTDPVEVTDAEKAHHRNTLKDNDNA